MANIKKRALLALLLGTFLFTKNVYAQEIYYQNDYGVILDHQEYNFISNMYWEGYQKYLTMEDYNIIKKWIYLINQ